MADRRNCRANTKLPGHSRASPCLEQGAHRGADLSGQNLKISEMFGASARDSILAAEGNGLLLSEVLGLRQWATAALEVGASWLQPVLLLAKDRGLISIED